MSVRGTEHSKRAHPTKTKNATNPTTSIFPMGRPTPNRFGSDKLASHGVVRPLNGKTLTPRDRPRLRQGCPV